MPHAASSEAKAYTTGRGGCTSGGAGLPEGPLCVWRGCVCPCSRVPACACLCCVLPPASPPLLGDKPGISPSPPVFSASAEQAAAGTPAKMSGQTLTDRIAAAQYSVTGSAVARAVCKATTHEVMGPKKKHLDCEHPFLCPQRRPGAEEAAREAL